MSSPETKYQHAGVASAADMPNSETGTDSPEQLHDQDGAAAFFDPEFSPGKAAGSRKRPSKRQRSPSSSGSKLTQPKKAAKNAPKRKKPCQESVPACAAGMDRSSEMQAGTDRPSGRDMEAKPGKGKAMASAAEEEVVQGGEPSDQVPAANAAQASSDVPRKEAKPVKGDKKGKGKAASSEAASAANVEGVSGSSAQPGHQAAAGSLAGQESLGLDSLPSSADDSPQPQADAAPKQSSGQIMHYCCVQEEQQARAMRAESCG